jgi:hypothetical protein
MVMGKRGEIWNGTSRRLVDSVYVLLVGAEVFWTPRDGIFNSHQGQIDSTDIYCSTLATSFSRDKRMFGGVS